MCFINKKYTCFLWLLVFRPIMLWNYGIARIKLNMNSNILSMVINAINANNNSIIIVIVLFLSAQLDT